MPASLNTYEFLQFPRLDKVYLNRDEININENTLTNMNILGKISQSDAYLLLNSELDIFRLWEKTWPKEDFYRVLGRKI